MFTFLMPVVENRSAPFTFSLANHLKCYHFSEIQPKPYGMKD